jgi:hypothetical protein
MSQGVQSEMWCDAPPLCEEITTRHLPRRGDIVVHRDHRYRVQDVLHFTRDEGDEADASVLNPVVQVCAIDPETCGTAEPDSGHD